MVCETHLPKIPAAKAERQTLSDLSDFSDVAERSDYLAGEVKQIHAETIPAINNMTPKYTPGGTLTPSGLEEKAKHKIHSNKPAINEINPPFLLRHLFLRIGSPHPGQTGAAEDTCFLQTGHSMSLDIIGISFLFCFLFNRVWEIGDDHSQTAHLIFWRQTVKDGKQLLTHQVNAAISG